MYVGMCGSSFITSYIIVTVQIGLQTYIKYLFIRSVLDQKPKVEPCGTKWPDFEVTICKSARASAPSGELDRNTGYRQDDAHGTGDE